MEYIKAVFLAVVEGATEFLPVSSTGHLIIAQEYVGLGSSDSFANTFLVAIQLPAILAVVWYFRRELWPFGKGEEGAATWILWSKVILAFLPAVVLGVLLDDLIESLLFHPVPVAVALVVGGVVLIVIERRGYSPRFESVAELSYGTALCIGVFQCLAMIPGTSRSAATIIGAMLLGSSRAAAAEFSFFLAIPTMFGATGYSLLKHGLRFNGEEWALLGVGSVVSFLVALGAVAFLMHFIRRHSFVVFGYYRVALGLAVLFVFLVLPMLLSTASAVN